VDKKRLNAICHYFLSHNLKLSWSCLGRVDLADATSLKLMKKAGCWLISYGIESASQEILDLYKKRINLAQIEHAIRITKQAGIQTRGFFMLGNPLESKDSLGRIKDLLRRLPLDDIHISFFTPIPGSESYNLSDRYGTFSRNWLDMDVYSLNFIPRDLTKDQLLKYRSQLYKSFYFRPARLMRYAAILFNPKRMLEIIKRGAVFIKLLSKNKY